MLKSAKLDNETIYRWLQKKSSGTDSGKIRKDRVLKGLEGDFGLDPIAIKRTLRQLRESNYIRYASTPAGDPISSFITVIRPTVNEPSHVILWRECVSSVSQLSSEDRNALEGIGESLPGFSRPFMEKLLKGIVKLRDEQKKYIGLPAYLVSARYLLGSSKLLQKLPSRNLKAFGIDPDRFTSHPPYIVMGGSNKPDGVILVENLTSFEAAISTNAASRFMFVATFGFGLSKTNNEYGNQLAGLVETHFEGAIGLLREGLSCVSVSSVLKCDQISFWGDLDLAGMQIYQRLKGALPKLKLSALYVPMIKAILQQDNCHPYTESVGKSGQRPSILEDVIAARLGTLCETCGVDQEIVTPSEIEEYAGNILADF